MDSAAAAAAWSNCGGQPTRRCRVKARRTTSTAAVSARIAASIRRRAETLMRRYCDIAPLAPNVPATRASRRTGQVGADGRSLHSTRPTATADR